MKRGCLLMGQPLLRTGRPQPYWMNCLSTKDFKRQVFLTHRITHFLFDEIYCFLI